ncbi:MAG: ribosome silencing factor [Aquabacterium sp.]
MDIRKLQRAIVDGLEDVKAQDIAVFNTEHLSPLFERVIIASGTSNRQTKALAASVRDAVRQAGFQVMRTEGQDNGEWIIVDCAAAVVHIMQPAIRQYYQLEEIWGEKPVAFKAKAVKTGLVKASEPMDEDDATPVKAKKATGKTTAAKKAATTAPTRSAAGKTTKKPAATPVAAPKKVAAKKAAAKTAPGRTAPGRTAASKTAAKKAVVRKVAAKKAPVKTIKVNEPGKKTVARKVAVKKVAAKKVAVKKVAAKKAPAKKSASRSAR